MDSLQKTRVKTNRTLFLRGNGRGHHNKELQHAYMYLDDTHNTNRAKNRDELRCYGRVAVSASLVTPIVLLLLHTR